MFTRIFTISLATLRELIRNKVLYSVFLFAFLVVAASALFGSVTIGDQVKVIKDFGLFAISIFSVGFSIAAGSALLHKELNKKTIYTILSRPVPRWEFLTGKFLGMFTTGVLLICLMGIGFSGFVSLFEGKFSFQLFQGYYHIVLELFIMCAAVIFFSSIVVTPILIGLFSFGLFLAGRSIELLLTLANQQGAESIVAMIAETLYWILPQLSTISISDALVHGDSISLSSSMWSTFYSFSYGILLLLIAQLLFQKREFNGT